MTPAPIITLKDQINYVEKFPDCDLKEAILGTINIVLTDEDPNEHSLIWRLNQEQANDFKEFTDKSRAKDKEIIRLNAEIEKLNRVLDKYMGEQDMTLIVKQAKLMIYLNDNMVKPGDNINKILKIMGFEFISLEKGWQHIQS